ASPVICTRPLHGALPICRGGAGGVVVGGVGRVAAGEDDERRGEGARQEAGEREGHGVGGLSARGGACEESVSLERYSTNPSRANNRRGGVAPGARGTGAGGFAFRVRTSEVCTPPLHPPAPPVIARYTRPEMGALWTEEAQYQAWLDVELAACWAWSEATGVIPKEDVERLYARASFDVARIHAIEAETRHDVVAFTRAVS